MIYDVNEFNRFSNLDSVQERIINYLILTNTTDINRIWKLLKYNTIDALLKDDLTQEEKAKLVDNDGIHQSEKKVFRYPFIEDAFTVESSILRIYVDNLIPKNHLYSTVNIGFEIISHNKISNVYNDASDEIEQERIYRPIEKEVYIKDRNTVLLKSLLSALNGADVSGVGVLQFNSKESPFDNAKYGIFNNKNYSGFRLIMSCGMSGVG